MLSKLPHILKTATRKKYSFQHLQAGKVKLLLCKKKAIAFPDNSYVNDPGASLLNGKV